MSDPTTADQCRVSASMRVNGGSYTMDTIGPALSDWYHIHSPFTTSLESGVTNQLKSSVCFRLSLSNCNKQGEEGERHTELEPDIPLTV